MQHKWAGSHGLPWILGRRFVLKAELTAILQGLLICKQQQFFPIWIETDSTVVLQIILSDHCSWEFRHTLTSIQNIRANHQTHISHVFREANAPADALAALGMKEICYSEFSTLNLDKHVASLSRLDSKGCPYIRIVRKLVHS
ncbi:hypothetical protein F511_41991 [Dorcoceras hygrometricum]|uniref:RNase H type-1 domain-containing protein n=1 Tax=Dorcoceras hygrometricum TaxID=472368 RepID=A0A2Z7C7Z9_9LAMI|nr:hypothetical protein F511_41991 [Dorcoceras hygrometricum]